ncbi:MAG: tetratricopeptide repeat protein [Ignavibacteria bacterium]|nr:tetratricopeptide repeat protein [Ignavibacteria bacterium]
MELSDLLNRASDCLKHGNSAEAGSICRSVLSAVSIENTDSPLTTSRQIADAHRMLAVACRLHGCFSEARQHADTAQGLYWEMGDNAAAGGAMIVKGLVHLDLGENQEALDRLLEARALIESAGDQRRLAQVICNIGNVYLNRGEYAAARDVYREAADRAQDIGDDYLLAYSLGNLGLVFRHLGDPQQALLSLEEALEIDTRNENVAGRARHLGNLGNVYQEIGDLQRAVTLYEEALVVHRQTGQRHNEATWLSNLGVLYQTLGDIEGAMQHYEMSRSIFHDLGAEMAEARSSARMGGVHLQRGEYKDAIELLEQALAKARHHNIETEVAIYASNLGHAHTLCGNFEDAEDYLNESLPLLEAQDSRHQIGVAWHYRGNILSDIRNPNRNVETAIEWIERALKVFLEIDAKRNAVEAHQALGELFRERSRWEEVAKHVQSAADLQVALINEETKLSTQRAYYQRQIDDIQRGHEQRRLEYLAKDTELQKLIDRLVEKNDLLRQISQRIGEATQHTRPQGEEKLGQVIDLIDRSLRTDSTGNVIDQLMLDVYDNFVRRIRLRVPAITDMELKVATLLHRQMTSANIADVLFLSKRTVEVHRHNLRKKMGLDASEDIYQVLRSV